MKKKIIGTIIFGFAFFMYQTKIDASLYSTDFMSDSEYILKCTYSSTKGKKKRVNLTFSLRNGAAQADLNVDGKDRSDEIILEIPDKPNENTMVKKEMLGYINEKGTCPQYISEFDSGYIFSDSEDAIKDGEASYKFEKVRYNKNYCFYSFAVNSNIAGTPMPTWGLFVSKDKFSNFSNEYNSEQCPEKVITELYESTEIDSGFNRKFFAAEKAEDSIIIDLKDKCEADAEDQVNEMYGEEENAPHKCYVGEKKELNNTKSDGTETEEIIDDTPLTCDALFDADAKKVISSAYFFIEIIAVLMVIGLTIKDYAAAILNSNADEMKKANKRLLTRLIVLTIILLLPALLNLIIKIFNIQLFNTDPLCGTLER